MTDHSDNPTLLNAYNVGRKHAHPDAPRHRIFAELVDSGVLVPSAFTDFSLGWAAGLAPEAAPLESELLLLERDLRDLNARRRDLYARSLAASQGDKAVADLVANAMLAGPLNEQNQIPWPVEVNGVGWVEDSQPAFTAGAPDTWCSMVFHETPGVVLPPKDDAPRYLGLELGTVPTTVLARLSPAKFVHLEYAGDVPLFYVPAKRLLATMHTALFSQLEHPDQLRELEDDPISPWYAAALESLSRQQAQRLAEDSDPVAEAAIAATDGEEPN